MEKNMRDLMYGVDEPVELFDGRRVPAVNLDNGATAPPFKEVVAEIEKQMLSYGSIGRGKGQKSEHSSRVYTDGRQTVKRFVGADSDAYEVFYTNCTTDGMNKLASALITSREDKIISTRMEHHANDLPWRERVDSGNIEYAEVDAKGRLIVDDIERLLREGQGAVKVVTVTAASNVTGYVNDIHRIAKMAHAHGAMMVVDAAQIVAHRAVRMLGETPEENIDFLVFSAHKMYSPFGGGAVVGLADVLERHRPVFYGGGMVYTVEDYMVKYAPPPDLYEAGSPNYPGVVGMLKAMEVLSREGFDFIQAHEQALLKKTIEGLKTIPGIILYGDCEDYTDRVGTVVFNIDGIENEEVAKKLAGFGGIAVRHAAFCAHPYVRRLSEPPKTDAQPDNACFPPAGMVRVSFGIYNTEADVDVLIDTIHTLLQGNAAMAFEMAAAGMDRAAPASDLPFDRG